MVSRITRRVRQYVDRTAAIRHAARRQYGVPWLPLQWRAMRLRKRYGWGLDESLSVGLLDPDTTLHPEVAASPRQTTDLQYFMNARQIEGVSEEKVIFHMITSAAGLPTPATFANLMDGAMGWDFANSRPIHPEAWARALDGMPEEIVIKPSQGYVGLGVRVLRRHPDGGWTEGADPRRIPSEEIVDAMRANPDFHDWIVQERLHNHLDLEVFGSPALHTLRMATYVRDDGTVEVLWAGFRIAVGENPVDNFRYGRLGNMTCELDLATGTITSAHLPRLERPGLVEVAEHPGSGVHMPGFRLPGWGECRELVQRAAPLFLPIRTVGFDLGLTPDGPKIVEINMWWDAPPVAPVKPILDRLWAEGRALA